MTPVTNNTDVFVICDLSGSMCGAPEAALRAALAEYLEALLAGATAGLAFDVTPVYFSNVARRGATFSVTNGFGRAEAVRSAVTRGPGMGGGTALMDALGGVLATVRPGVPTLVSLFTDGEECSSRVYNPPGIAALVSRLQATGLVTITAAGPSGAREVLTKCGVPADNFRSWDGSAKEMAQVSCDTVDAVKTYSATRSLGRTATTRFYADASKLTPSGVKALTQEVTPKSIETVARPMAGRPICDHFGPRFEQGKHFYELVKPEYVQEDKDLIVHVKDHGEYRRGSRGVRAMLGLPETGKVCVHPGPTNDKFTVFVQTSSFNRKLVEGQRLLTVD